jgi:2-polyprenyl-6-methoxyphenol hydroxylase-like FAD-dependent oxidoreductase
MQGPAEKELVMTEPQPTAPPASALARVAILGAGPVGLEAALAAVDAGWPFTVYESAARVGGNVARWAHVRLFTPWSMNVSERMARHLRAAGHRPPEGDDRLPTGTQLVTELLEPLAGLPEVASHVVCGTRVLGVGREGLLKHEEIGTEERAAHPFRILLRCPDGTTTTERASLVLDCTGNYTTPNAAGDGGVPAPGEDELGDRIVRTMPDLARERDAWRGRTILLIGAGWSAQTTARDLAAFVPSAPGTQVIWAVRRANPTWGEVADDPLPERQAFVESSRRIAAGQVPGMRVELGAVVDAFEPDGERILARLRGGAQRDVRVDRVLSLTGYVPDTTLYRQLQVHECYATAAPIALSAQLLGDAAGNCLEPRGYGVDVLRSPEPNFFLLGAKSYGRNSEFLMRNGYEQVDEVANAYGSACG